MKLLTSTIAMFLLAGTPAIAWQEQDNRAQQREEQKQEKSEKATQQEQAKQQKEARQQQDRAKQQQQAEKQRQQQTKQQAQEQQKEQERQARQQQEVRKQQQQEEKQVQKQQQQQAKLRQEQDRQQRQESRTQREQATTGTHGSRRIPDDRFRASFGRTHEFHIHRTSSNRIQLGSFWFEVVEPWPVFWIFDDPCYLDFIDGEYYLIDFVHPEVRVLVIVVV